MISWLHGGMQLSGSCYLYFKSKMEVLRENTGPSHWDPGVLFTDGTLKHLLETIFLYLMMETLLQTLQNSWVIVGLGAHTTGNV